MTATLITHTQPDRLNRQSCTLVWAQSYPRIGWPDQQPNVDGSYPRAQCFFTDAHALQENLEKVGHRIVRRHENAV